jgi:uracil-DNA glycosylase
MAAAKGTTESTFDFLPDELNYPTLKAASAECRGCDLYRNATQTVFGEGDTSSGVIFVGEQPGDEEDLKGRPFVGPAGRLFDKALKEAGIDREKIYLTNTVKHFKWKPQGKRRIHQKPNAAEITACDPWLRSELIMVQPKILVCLGATAAQSLLGKQFRVTQMRGKWLESELAPNTIATIHPSAILRTPGELRDAAFADFVSDLVIVAEAIDTGA